MVRVLKTQTVQSIGYILKRRNETKYKNCSEVLKPLILQAFQHLIKPDKTYSYLAFSNVKINSVPTPSVLITLMCCPCA